MASNSSAYNLSAYKPRPQEQAPQKAPVRVVKSQPRAFAAAFTPSVLFAFAIIMTLLSLIVYNQVYLNELTREVNELNNQLAILESDGVRYASLLESTVSLRVIAQQAEDMGMVRLDPYRTVYVYLYEENQLIFFRPPQAQYDQGGFLTALSSLVRNAVEYIAGT